MNTTSGQFSPPKSQEEEYIQTLCKQLLKAKIFKGIYQERRYVESLAGYRDLILLDSTENELKDDLKYLRQRITKFYDNENLWVGISLPDMIGTPAGVCIWTEISDLAFGQYSFFIKSVKFRQNEVIVKVKVVQPEECKKEEPESDENKELTVENLYDLWVLWKDSIRKSILNFLSQDLNSQNIGAAIKFICLLMLSLAAASIQAIKFIGIFSLHFMKETRLLLHTCTPIFLKIIDLLGKVIGGLFIMVTMLYRDIVDTFRGPRLQQIKPPKFYEEVTDGPYKYNSKRRSGTYF